MPNPLNEEDYFLSEDGKEYFRIDSENTAIMLSLGFKDNCYNAAIIKQGDDEVWLDGYDIEKMIRIFIANISELPGGKQIIEGMENGKR